MNRLFPTASPMWTANWLRAMALLSMLAWLNGCATRVVVIPADREVVPLEAGQNFRAPSTGWWVPDARMQEILHALEAKAKP